MKLHTTKTQTRSFVNQALDAFFETNKTKPKTIVSLPEEQWAMESAVIPYIQESTTPVSLFCFEKDKKRYKECLSNPRISSMIKEIIKSSREKGVFFAKDNSEAQIAFNFSYQNKFLPPLNSWNALGQPVFAWYDYCGTPSEERLQEFTSALPYGSVAAVTFCLSDRGRGYDSKLSDPDTIQVEIANRLNNIQVHGTKKLTECIHLQYYKSSKEKMVLMIFTNSVKLAKIYEAKLEVSEPLPSKPKTVTKEFLEGLKEGGASIPLIMEEYNMPRHRVAKILNPPKKKLSKNRANAIRAEFLTLTNEKEKEEFRDKVCSDKGISRGQYGSIIAHTQGKLGEKRRASGKLEIEA